MITTVRHTLSNAPLERSTTRPLADVDPVDDGPPGWYRVARSLTATELDYISEGQLTRGNGPRAPRFDVLEVALDGDLVRVRTSVTAPRERLSLTVRGTGPRRVLQGLTDGLEATRGNPLMSQFTERRLTPVRPDSRLPASVHAWGSLKPAQRDAVAACCAPGLQLVWGPPGTGKTHVIAAAISHLVRSGRRVLLVSSTNIAVDTALEQVLRLLDTSDPGQAVRVGNIHLPRLQGDDRVQLDRLVQARQATAQQQVDRLAAQLDELAGAGSRFTDAESRLTGFDPTAFQQATRRIANNRKHQQVTSELAPTEAELRQAQARARETDHQRLALAYREAIAQETQLNADLDTVETALAALGEAPLRVRVRRPGAKGKLAAQQGALRVELAQAAATRRQALDAARAAGADPEPADLPDADRIASAVQQAAASVDAATRRLVKLREETRQLTRSGLASAADQTLVAAQQQLWDLHRRLPQLREAVGQAGHQRPKIERAYEEALGLLRDQRHGLEKQIVAGARVVATTLAQIALRPWLTATPYDHVIVDEAAAAGLPHVLHAVGRASTGAVLVGDYLQNGPIVDDSFPGGDAKRLFKADCFSHFGATNPAWAQSQPGCVVLTEQFRFGPALTELANHVAYRGLLSTAGTGLADIVVVTVDGLPEDIAAVRRSSAHKGWWLVGALLARALAEHHNDAGTPDAFGVVVPYKDQVTATRAALEDSSLARLTPIGTSHSYQGRQFEVVLADLVEDGHGRMTTADLRGRDYDVDSVRLFNVAATRPRRRLYVLVGRGALEHTRNGPLAALRHMVRTGSAHRVDADQLLGLADPEPPDPDSPEADLIAALAPYVRIEGVHDEDAAIHEIIARIDSAERTVWCWSAWVGRFAEDIIAALERAHQRGVEVHVVARPESGVQPANQESLRRLAARLPHVVRMHDMHQKIVVVDEQWSIVGSFNALSHGPTSSRRLRDLMVTMDGTRFADQLLHHELADELARRHHCPTCRDPLIECGLIGKGRDRGWAWICPSPCNGGQGTRKPFPVASSGTWRRRNDRSRS